MVGQYKALLDPQGPILLTWWFNRHTKRCFLLFFWYFLVFLSYFQIFGQILRFLVKITWFLRFSGKNDAESLWNFVKNLILNPKRAKIDQKLEIGHARTCPGGQVFTSNHRKYFYFFRFYVKPSEILLFFQILHLSIFY